jgi:protein JSN1
VKSCRVESTRADTNSFAQFASPSIDMPYMPNQGGIRIPGLTPPGPGPFEQQPNLGGLGIMGQQAGAGMYYQGGMVSVSETRRGRYRANPPGEEGGARRGENAFLGEGHSADGVSQGGMYARAGYHA